MRIAGNKYRAGYDVLGVNSWSVQSAYLDMNIVFLAKMRTHTRITLEKPTMSDDSAEKWWYENDERFDELYAYTNQVRNKALCQELYKALGEYALAHNAECVQALKDAVPLLRYLINFAATNGDTEGEDTIRALLARIQSLTEGKQP